jgi:serine/threonine protein kinase
MPDPQPRCLAERYRRDRPIGRGGMGEVWAGHDLRLGRPVAIKLLRPDMAQVVEARRRFEAEATAAAKLTDPHVVAIFDTGEESGIPYIVMELLSGETLSDELRRGPLGAVETRQIAEQLLSALTTAHQAGIVHRDVKPGNVLRAGPATWKLGDFGIAKSLEAATELTMTGLVPGTPAYVAPERLDGAPATPTADLYSLGVVLYEALSGHRPFSGDTPLAAMHAIQTADPTPLEQLRPDLDPALTGTVARAMQRDPRRRFANAAAMRAALSPDRTSARTQSIEPGTEPIRPPQRTGARRGTTRTLVRRPPPARRPQPRWGWAAFAFATVVVVAVVVALATHHGSNAPATSTSGATAVTTAATPVTGPSLPAPLANALQRLDQTVRP